MDSLSQHSFPSWNSLSKATASFFPTPHSSQPACEKGGKKGGREFQGAKHGKYKQDLTLRPVVPRAEEAEGAGGGAGAPVSAWP